MLSKRQLDNMSLEISMLTSKYHNAVGNNLKEAAKELRLHTEDEEEEGLLLMVDFDGQMWQYRFDRIKWDDEKNTMMVHYTEFDYGEEDDWMDIYSTGMAMDYILDAIIWDEPDKDGNAVVDFPILTLSRDDIRDFLGVEDTDEISDEKMKDIASSMEKWYLEDTPHASGNAPKKTG